MAHKDPEKVRKYNKKYRQNHLEQERAHHKKYHQEHKEEINARSRKYRQNHLEQERARSKKYYQEHKEQMKEYYREHRKDHRKQYVIASRKWAINHREQYNTISRRRRARKAGAEGSHTAAEIEFLRSISGGFCPGYNRGPHYVGEEALTADHTIPLAQGGSDGIENIDMMCGSCNSSKGVR